MSRHLVPALAVGVAVLLATPSSTSAAPCWSPPVVGVVSDPFRAPACPYCAGNRGIEFRVGINAPVRAVASGVVTWAGVVAGTRYVVVRHATGWRATYGRLTTTSLTTGDVVLAGTVVGAASGSFHFGLRAGDRYLDPAPYLGELRGRPRLVPIDGRPPRPAPPARRVCPAGGVGARVAR